MKVQIYPGTLRLGQMKMLPPPLKRKPQGAAGASVAEKSFAETAAS